MLISNLDLLATAPGGVARLRELILTLSVQGKLVPQDASDEPASELLKQIRVEKDRLMAEGKKKRAKTLAEIEDEEKPFVLPIGWEWVRNEALLSLRKGKNPKTLSDRPIGKAYLDIEALDRHQIRRYSNETQAVHCTVGDILVVCDGSRSGLVLQGQDGIVGSTLAVIETPQFIQAYIRLIFRAGFQRFNSGMKGAAIPHLDTKTVLGEVTGLPPLAEQSRIVTRVEELMRLCDALEAKGQLEATQHAQLVSTLLATLTDSETPAQLADNWHRIATHFDLLLDRPQAVDALEQTILQLAVRGLLVPQDPQDEPAHELLKNIRTEKDKLIAEGKIKRDKPLAPIAEDDEPFALPSGWVWARLGDICLQVTDGTHQTPKYTDVGRPFLSAKNVKPFRFMPTPHRFVSESDFHDLRKGRAPTVGDILMTRVGAMIGEAAVIDSDIEFAFYVSLALLSLPKSHLSPEFIVNWLNSPFGTANSVEKTLGRGVSAGNLNLTFIRSFAIPLPPLAEQSRIVTRVTELRRLCADLRQRQVASQSTQSKLAESLVAEVT